MDQLIEEQQNKKKKDIRLYYIATNKLCSIIYTAFHYAKQIMLQATNYAAGYPSKT